MPATVVINATKTDTAVGTVEKFTAAGWTVVAPVRNESALADYDGLPGVHALPLLESAPELFAADAEQQSGPVTALVNHTDDCTVGPLTPSRTPYSHDRLSSDLLGLIAMSWAFLPGMRARGHGHIINVAAITTARGGPLPHWAPWGQTISTVSDSMRRGLAEFGVVVEAILSSRSSPSALTAETIFHTVTDQRARGSRPRPTERDITRQAGADLRTRDGARR